MPGPRWLLPIEVTKRLGPLDVDFEAGYYLPKQDVRERILGLVVGRSLTERLDLAVELYNDHAIGAPPNQTTLDLGGRFKLTRGFIALFMAVRSCARARGNARRSRASALARVSPSCGFT